VTTLYLVRHAETVWHQENKYAGHTDIQLTELGHQQAAELIPWIKAVNPNVIASSDSLRAKDTALPLAESLGKELVIESRFREVNFGEIEGLTPDEMLIQYPELRAAFLLNPADTRMPGGESGREAVNRALPGLIELLARKDNEIVIIVCHGTLMRLLTCSLLGINLNEYRRTFPIIPNTGKIALQVESIQQESISTLTAIFLELIT
jgi:broad specificity phosphatase PhoE